MNIENDDGFPVGSFIVFFNVSEYSHLIKGKFYEIKEVDDSHFKCIINENGIPLGIPYLYCGPIGSHFVNVKILKERINK